MNLKSPARVVRTAGLLLLAYAVLAGSLCPKTKAYRARFQCQFQLWQGETYIRTVNDHAATLKLYTVSEDGRRVTSSTVFEETGKTDDNGYRYMSMHGFNINLDASGLFATEKIRAEGIMVYEGETYKGRDDYLPNVQEDPELHEFNFAVKVDINARNPE
jgi:hypothetical protein